MTVGAKPRPTKVKILLGEKNKDRINLHEPQPEVGIPKCPNWLDNEARREWKRIVPELLEMGVLTLIDRPALAGYCAAYSRWRKAETALKNGFTYEFIDPKSYKVKRAKIPEVQIAIDSLNQVKAFLVEFGLTPSSRSRLTTTPKKSKDPMDMIIEAKGRDN